MNNVLEIPLNKDKPLSYRLLEILPGLASWFILGCLVLFAYIMPGLYSYIIVFYILNWVIKSFIVVVKTQIGYQLIRAAKKEEWSKVNLKSYKFKSRIMEKYYHRMMLNMDAINEKSKINLNDITHIILIPVYNESFNVVNDTISSIQYSDYDLKNRVVVVITYEERTGKDIEDMVLRIKDTFNSKFKAIICNKHILKTTEVPGKGANITSASDVIIKYCNNNSVKPRNAIVTTLDADNIISNEYFRLLDLTYCSTLNPEKASFQPTILYTNNIWDVPAVARMLAVNNTIWSISQSIRPRLLRNFSSHAQSLESLINTNFWSSRTIVEDGHQYWRSIFALNGEYRVVPFYATVNHDAVISEKYFGIFKAQFAQIRRWAYGVSDVPYAFWNIIKNHNDLKGYNLFKISMKFIRLIDTHITWATNSFIILVAPSLPILLGTSGRYDNLSSRLPSIAGSIQTLALISLFFVLMFNIIILPKRPIGKSRARYLLIAMQWLLSPIVGIIYGSCASLYSQTKLMFGRYYESFEVTEKKG